MSVVPARKIAAQARRIVVKVGSSVLTRDGALRVRAFSDIARQVAKLREEKEGGGEK